MINNNKLGTYLLNKLDNSISIYIYIYIKKYSSGFKVE